MQRNVDSETNDHNVRDGPKPGALSKWDPPDQRGGAHYDHNRAETPAEPRRRPAVEHIPRVEPEPRPHHDRHRCAVGDKADIELKDASGHRYRLLYSGMVFHSQMRHTGHMSGARISTTAIVTQLGAWNVAGPAHRDLADALELLIADGRVPLDVRLPSERDLAVALDLSRTTITTALRTLRARGYLTGEARAAPVTALPYRASHRCDTGGALTLELDLSSAAPAALPLRIHRALIDAVARLAEHYPTHGYHRDGVDELREALASDFTRRGAPTRSEQITITNGALHAFSLSLRAFARPGDRVVVEHPTYPNALDAIAGASLRAVAVPLEPQGWDLDLLASTVAHTRARVVYLMPDFQNPSGLLMGNAQRRDLWQWAASTDVVVVIDETHAQLHIDGPVPPVNRTVHHGAQVVLLGSSSKTYWGGLRVGWIRGDRSMIDRINSARTSLDMGSPVVEQLAVSALLGDDAVIAERRQYLLEQRRHVEKQLKQHLPELSYRQPGGGLSIWADLGSPLSSALTVRSERLGLHLAAGPRFGIDGAFERWLRIPFTSTTDDLTLAIERLATAYHQLFEQYRGARTTRPLDTLVV